jgi:hypothetical protein
MARKGTKKQFEQRERRERRTDRKIEDRKMGEAVPKQWDSRTDRSDRTDRVCADGDVSAGGPAFELMTGAAVEAVVDDGEQWQGMGI